MSQSRPSLPPPTLTATNAGFFEAAFEGRLVVQCCDDCGAHRHSPTAACYRCQSLRWSWAPHAGNGTVFSYTWSHHPVHPGLAELGVYNIAVVELDDTEGDPVRLVSFVTDVSPDELFVGLRVEVHFDPVSEGVALPVFRRRGDL